MEVVRICWNCDGSGYIIYDNKSYTCLVCKGKGILNNIKDIYYYKNN